MSLRKNKNKGKNGAEERAPLIEDPLKGASLPSHIASLLTFDKMAEWEQSKKNDVSLLQQNIQMAEERAIAEGRDPREDESVQQFKLFQMQRAEDEVAVDKLLAQRSKAAYAHSAAMSSKSGADPTHRIPSMRLAKRTYWPTRRVPDDQTAHVMWARTASILQKYYQILAMQEHMSGEGGRKTMHMPRYHDYEKWIEQHFRVPVVFVRRNACARQTWLGHQDRQPTFFMQRPFDVPMPQSNHHGAFQNASSQNDDLLHEVRYLNMIELSALAILSTSRPGACFEFEWDGTLPGVDVFDLRPDNCPHKFVWDDRKAREYSGDREQAARYVTKNFPEQRIDVYETYLRFDSEAFEERGGTFDDDPNQFWVPQNREVIFDQFYVHANTFEDPVEDGKALSETHAAVFRLFSPCGGTGDTEHDERVERQHAIFPTAAEVLTLLETGQSEPQHSSSGSSNSSTVCTKDRMAENAWSERRRTSPYDVVVDREVPIGDTDEEKQEEEEKKEAEERERASEYDQKFPYDVITLEQYTRRQQKKQLQKMKKQESCFRYQNASNVSGTDNSSYGMRENLSRERTAELDDVEEFEECSNPVPSDTLRRNQKYEDSQREKDKNEWMLDDITRLPYYRDLYNNLEKVAGPEWALPTSDTRDDDGGNKPARLTRYQYVRAFLYLAVRRAKRLHPNASASEIAELVLPTKDRNAMSQIRQWLTKRRKQQRETPNFRAWSSDVLKAIDVWMTRVCEAVEFCYHNDPGPEKKRTNTCLDTAEIKKARVDMWRRVEALFPAGIVSMMPEAWRRQDEPVPPLPCDKSDGRVGMSRKEEEMLEGDQNLEHPDAFGVPKIAQADRLYQELFLEEPRESDWIEDRYKGAGSTQYWEDRKRQEKLSRTANGAPTRGDRINPLLCSRHFRNVVLPAGGATLPAWSQREHWIPMYYADEEGKNESNESIVDDSAREQEWESVALVYDSVSQLLFPERRGAKHSRGGSTTTKHNKNKQRVKNTVTRIGGGSCDSRDKKEKKEKNGKLSALLASSRTKRGNVAQHLPTSSTTDDHNSPLQWNWSNYRDQSFLRGAVDHDTFSPFDVVEKLKRSDPHYEKRHPNLVHGDVHSADENNGSDKEHIDALFSIVTEPLMDARHLHTHDQVDMRGRVDNESNMCFSESVQRPLNNNPFHRFFHLFLTTCSANDLPQVSVEEWEQIEQFSRRVMYALEPLEFDQSCLFGDDRFVAKAADGRLRANQNNLNATGEQPLQVQAGARALQTLSYAFRSARFSKVIERVETMLGYVPWIYRENVLEPFLEQDSPFSTLYDYGVNACVSVRNNARFHPRGRHPHCAGTSQHNAVGVRTELTKQQQHHDRNNVLQQAAKQQAAKNHKKYSLSAPNNVKTDKVKQIESKQQQQADGDDDEQEQPQQAEEEEEEEVDIWQGMQHVKVDTVSSNRDELRVDTLQKLKNAKCRQEEETTIETVCAPAAEQSENESECDSIDDLLIRDMLNNVKAAQLKLDTQVTHKQTSKEETSDCEQCTSERDNNQDDEDSSKSPSSSFKLWQNLVEQPCETRYGSTTRRSIRLKQKTVAKTSTRDRSIRTTRRQTRK